VGVKIPERNFKLPGDLRSKLPEGAMELEIKFEPRGAAVILPSGQITSRSRFSMGILTVAAL